MKKNAFNTLLLKINQIGTISDAMEATKMTTESKRDIAVSIRSCDTNNSFITNLAVAIGAIQIKLGSSVRGERNAKYNRFLRIQSDLDIKAGFAGAK